MSVIFAFIYKNQDFLANLHNKIKIMNPDAETIAFKIKVNKEYLCTAGIKEGVLTAIATYIKRKEGRSNLIVKQQSFN